VKRPFLHEVQINTASGGLMWIETSSHYEYSENGDILIIGVSRDIDEFKKSELKLRKYTEKLKASEELFISVFNESPVSMILSDPVTRVILDVNKALTSTIGLSREDLISREFFSIGLDILDDRAITLGRMLVTDMPVRNYEVGVTTPKGDKFDFLLTVKKIKIGGEYKLLTTAVDITERKKGERRIARMLEQEKLLADISQILNQPGELKTHLDEVLRMVGDHTCSDRVFIDEEFDNGKFYRNTYESCSEGIDPIIDEKQGLRYSAMPSWKKYFSGRSIINLPDIKDLPVELFNVLSQFGVKSLLGYVLGVKDEIIGFMGFAEYRQYRTWRADEVDLLRIIAGIISNAIKRNLIANQMEFSNTRLNLAIEGANEGLWDIDLEKNQLYTNDRCITMLGYKKGELELDYSKLWSSIHPDDRNKVREAFDNHLNGENEKFDAVYRLKAKDNNWKWILDHGRVVMRSPEGKPLRFMGTRLDINDQKENELKLHQLVETQDKLFSIIAHDLRGPIGSFAQGIELLTDGTLTDENLKKRLMEELRKTSQTTYRLLENLLNWSISKANIMNIEPEPLRIKQLIEENLKLLAAFTLQKSIRIKVEADDSLMAFADRDSVNLVLRNLLNNAVKFTPTLGMVKISAHDAGQKVELQVNDTGIGMSRELVENLFKLNNYNSSLGTNNEKGSGIGLVLCKDVVERNGGSIWAESIPGSGSSFRFTLPRYAS
jgi:PAS domain S-box-containing protein